MITENEINKERDCYDSLVMTVFRTVAGQELLNKWRELYIEMDLFAETDREQCYNIGQRDFVLELTVKFKEGK